MMNNLAFKITVFLFILSAIGLQAQNGNVGIGISSPDASAVLEVFMFRNESSQ